MARTERRGAAEPTRRNVVRLALSLAGAATFARPALAQSRAPVKLLLGWRMEGLAALFLVAQDKGFFGAEGVDVVVEPGMGSRLVAGRIAAGEGDAGFGDVNALIRLRDGKPGLDLKAVMMVQDRAGFAIIGRRSRGITDLPRSLEGRRLGAPAADAAFAQWPLFKALTGIDESRIRIETIGFAVREPMLASGEVDAVFGFGPAVLAGMKARGVPADDLVVLNMADHGLTLYGNAVMVSPKLAADEPETVRSLLRALVRSVREVAAEPDLGLQAIARRADIARPELDREHLVETLRQTVLTPFAREHGIGGIDAARWGEAVYQLDRGQALRDKAKAGESFTAAFLPARDARLF